jgi:hypothetical protein
MTNPQWLEGSMAIARFYWPAARSTITEMSREVLGRMIGYIEHGE